MPIATHLPNFWSTLLEANRRRSAIWGGSKLDLAFKGLELGGEVGEFLNHLKKLQRERLQIGGSRTTIDAAMLEAGDVLICLALVFNELGVGPDKINEAVVLAFNNKSHQLGLPVFINAGGEVTGE